MKRKHITELAIDGSRDDIIFFDGVYQSELNPASVKQTVTITRASKNNAKTRVYHARPGIICRIIEGFQSGQFRIGNAYPSPRMGTPYDEGVDHYESTDYLMD